MMQKKVSVIIPVYNVEQYLCECLDSIVNQTYKNLQIILVDDGSADSSGKICDRYQERDNRIEVIHKINEGQSIARNVAMDRVRGKYICFVDSDDLLKLDAIEQLLDAAVRNQAEIVFYDSEILYSDCEIQETQQLSYHRPDDFGSLPGIDMLLRLYEKDLLYFSAPLSFISNALVQRIGLRFYEGIIHEDNLFVIHAGLSASRITHLWKELYIRRVRPNSTTTTVFSYRNLHGYATCLHEVHSLIQKGGADSERMAFWKMYLKRTMQIILHNYPYFSASEKPLSRKEIRSLGSLLKEVDYFGSWKLRLFVWAPDMVCLIKRMKLLLRGRSA